MWLLAEHGRVTGLWAEGDPRPRHDQGRGGRTDQPYIRAAGTWVARNGALPEGLTIELQHAADLVDAVRQQLGDRGPGQALPRRPGPRRGPVHGHRGPRRRGRRPPAAKVAAHATALAGNRVGAEAGVDSLEHGTELDTDTVALMAGNGVTLVSTLAVIHSWGTFTRTSTVPRFTDPEGRAVIGERLETTRASGRPAHAAGVAIAVGSDAGGGSLRANQLVWEAGAMVAAASPTHCTGCRDLAGGDLLGDLDAGRLCVGGTTHFSLVHGDPLTAPKALWRIWMTR